MPFRLRSNPTLVAWEEDGVPEITVDVWLYGKLARYGGEAEQGSFANLRVCVPEEATINDLLTRIGLATEERGITFINGQLTAMPGLQTDLGQILCDGDRVGFFDPKSMWPFQYRHGAAMTEPMSRALLTERHQGLRHTYSKGSKSRLFAKNYS